MKKKILLVDDSALTRRVVCDIINSDDRFEVADIACDGVEGFKYVCEKRYDAVVLDVYMPRMTGLQMLKEMKNSNVMAKVMMSSTTTEEGARETLEALSLGAIDFIKKPENVADVRSNMFVEHFLSTLNVVASATLLDVVAKRRANAAAMKEGGTQAPKPAAASQDAHNALQPHNFKLSPSEVRTGKKIVAIASSTGGPRALQEVVPYLPGDFPVPIVLVQHMPKGFTSTFADRLNEQCPLQVAEAKEGEVLQKGHLYIAPGGKHLKIVSKGTFCTFQFTDEPTREGVKPCANYMYESLVDSPYNEVVCVVLTGMGADGTAGIKNLAAKKNVHVIAQDEATSTVYGMPRCIAMTGLVNEIVPITEVANQIIKSVGVR